MQAMWTGLSALKSSSDWLDRVGDNLANMNTPGFAQDQGSFADALTMQLYGAATDPENARRTTPPGWRGGTGVVSVPEGQDFSNMSLQPTNNEMDLAIQGSAFFAVQGPNGTLYTKAGDFEWAKSANGQFLLSTPNGDPVLSTMGQPIVKPANAGSMSVGSNGQISFGSVAGPRIAMVDIPEPSSHCVSVGNNLYALGPGGTAQAATDSSIQQGYLAMSNVNETTQLSDMIEAQQMFQLNSESIQLTNQMMGIADSIRSSGS